MYKKGSITIFMVLVLSLVVALVCTSIESVRMAAARTQILNGMDIGLYSLFGQYDKTLLDEYDLFVLDGSGGDGTLNMAAVYDNFKSYMKPILKQNSQKLSMQQGGFTGYRLLTDEKGEVFYQQIVDYMQETLGSQGVQLLLQKMKERQEKTEEAQKTGEQAENGDSLHSYDTEMGEAAQNSQAARQEMENQQNAEGNGGQEGFAPPETPEPVENPIPVIKRIRKMGILDLLVPASLGISDRRADKRQFLSGRDRQEGLALPQKLRQKDGASSQVLFQQYLMSKLGHFRKPAAGGLCYEIEYILGGKDSDEANLKSVAQKLLLIREGVNFAHLMADAGKRSQVEALSLAIASGFLIPPAAVVIEAALFLCWSFAESVLDVRELFDGGHVPLVKTNADWQLSLENLPRLLDGLDSVRRDSGEGMTYEDYLQVLLLTEGKQKKVERSMDMVEQRVRAMEGRGDFRLDSCIVALEAAVDVKANKRKVFQVTRQYCYE